MNLCLPLAVFFVVLVAFWCGKSRLRITMSERLRELPIASASDSGQLTGSTLSRFLLLKAGFRAFSKHPIVGLGTGNFCINSVHYGALSEQVVHNLYVEFLAELGLIGLILFVVLIGIGVRNIYHLRANYGNTDFRPYVIGLQLAFVALLVEYLFLSAFALQSFTLILSLIICLRRISDKWTVDKLKSHFCL